MLRFSEAPTLSFVSALSVTCWGSRGLKKEGRARAVLFETCLLARASYQLMPAGVTRRLFVFESLKGKRKPLTAKPHFTFFFLSPFGSPLMHWSNSKGELLKRTFLCCTEIWIWYIMLPWLLLKFTLSNVTLKSLCSSSSFTFAWPLIVEIGIYRSLHIDKTLLQHAQRRCIYFHNDRGR